MRLDAFGICLLKQTASSAQSVTSPSKIEGFREFEADLSALFWDLGDEPYGREQNQGNHCRDWRRYHEITDCPERG